MLKCLGKNRVGFLSGAAFTTDSPRPFYVRIAYVNAAILFIVFVILSVTNGITNLNSAVSTVGDSNTEVQSILSDARGIAISLKSIGQSSLEVRQELEGSLGNFCPAEPNIEALTGIDFDALASEAIALLNQLGNFIENDVDNFQTQLRRAQDTSTFVGNTVDTIEANDWQSLVILIPYLSMAVFLLLGVALAWCNKTCSVYTCMLKWGITPLFVCATIAAFCISAFVCFGAVANADACSGGASRTPDGTVYAALDSQGIDPQSMYYRAIRYYVEVRSNSSCFRNALQPCFMLTPTRLVPISSTAMYHGRRSVSVYSRLPSRNCKYSTFIVSRVRPPLESHKQSFIPSHTL